MNKLSNQDRTHLIRLASTMPVGSDVRRALLAGLSRLAASYKDYLEKAKKDGKDPISEDEWEARFGKGSGKSKGDTGSKGVSTIKSLAKDLADDLDEYSKAGETPIPDAMENIASGKFDPDEVMGALKALRSFEKDGQTKGFSSEEKAGFKAAVEYLESVDSAQDALFGMQKTLFSKGNINGAAAPKEVKEALKDLAYGKGGDKKKVQKWLQENEGDLDLSDKQKKAIEGYLKTGSRKRRRLIRLASQMPAGTDVRRAVLAGLSKTSGIEEQYIAILAKAADKYLDRHMPRSYGFSKVRDGATTNYFDEGTLRRTLTLSAKGGKMTATLDWAPEFNDFMEEQMFYEDPPEPVTERLTGDVERDIRTLKEMLR